jgi:hypothetical protein
MNQYTATFPLGTDPRDLFATSLANLPTTPDFPQTIIAPNTLTIVYVVTALTGPQLAAWQAAVAATVADPNAPYRKYDNALGRLQNIVAALNNQANQLAALSPSGVTAGNVVTVVQGIVNNLAVDLARLADLITATGLGN